MTSGPEKKRNDLSILQKYIYTYAFKRWVVNNDQEKKEEKNTFPS